MARGFPFPDVEKLRRAMALRGWKPAELARRADISPTSAYKVLRGRNCAVEIHEAVARAMRDNPPTTATAEFVLGDAV